MVLDLSHRRGFRKLGVYVTTLWHATAGGGLRPSASPPIPMELLLRLNNGVPFAAGVHPSAIISDHAGANVYVTDAGNSAILGFQISSWPPGSTQWKPV